MPVVPEPQLLVASRGVASALAYQALRRNAGSSAYEFATGVWADQSYADPSWLTALAAAKVTGLGSAALQPSSAFDAAGAAAAALVTAEGYTDSALAGYVPTSRTVNGHALSANVTVSKSDVGLGSVENTALSTWAGSTSLTTLGTVAAGSIPQSLVTGLGTLATLSAAPAGTLTGTTLAANVVSSSLTSVGTLASGSIPYSLLTGTPSIPAAANPSGLIGMTAVNGVASTFDRSDATHAIDPAIAPTWTGSHAWAPTASGAVAARFRASTTSPGNIVSFDDSTGTILSKINSAGAGFFPRLNLGTATDTAGSTGVAIYAVGPLYNNNNGGPSFALNSAGTNYGLIQNDSADTWSLSTNTVITNGTPILQWTKLGAVTVRTLAAGTIPLTVKGAASQSAVLLQLQGLSSTSTAREQVDVDTAWATSTDASRKARGVFRVWDTAAREAIRMEASGTEAMLGFYGVSAIARAVLATGAGATVDNVITALQNLGLVKQS